MPHRAEQIAEAIAASLAPLVTNQRAKIFLFRALALAGADAELPAVCVNLGDDAPVAGNLAFLDSELVVTVTLYADASAEAELLRTLMDLRAASHVALAADSTQGLNFVMDTGYGGASAPEISDDVGRFVGRYATRWLVLYRMRTTDPT